MKSLIANKYSPIQRIFFAAMILCICLFCALLVSGNLGNQSDVVLYSGKLFQEDNLNTEEYAAFLNPYDYSTDGLHVPFPHANYLPLAYGFYHLLFVLSGRDVSSSLAMAVSVGWMVLSALLLFLILWKLFSADRCGILPAFICLLSAPSIFAFERGNLIYFTVVLIAFFLLFYRSENWFLKECAFLSLAIAAAWKVFPALFGVLLLSERKWKEAARLVAYGILFTFLPFLFIQGGFRNIPLLLENVQAHTAFYSRLIYPRFGFRLFSSLFYNLHWNQPFLEHNLWKVAEKMEAVFPHIDLVLSLGCLSCLFADLPDWKKTVAIATVLVNYPVNSGLYTALYYLPCLMLFLKEASESKYNLFLVILFLLILSPLQIAFPYQALGIQAPDLFNLTNIYQNLSSYLIFLISAAAGFSYWRKRITAVFHHS